VTAAAHAWSNALAEALIGGDVDGILTNELKKMDTAQKEAFS
jgi:hypothetical protein